MFQRIIYDNWTSIVPIVSFCVTAGVFLLVSLRAITLPRERREQLARIPLEKEQTCLPKIRHTI